MNESSLLVLKALEKDYKDAREIARRAGVSYDSVMSALKGLEEAGYAALEREVEEKPALTGEGSLYAKNGLPERRLYDAVVAKALPLDEAVKKAGLSEKEKGIALQWAKRNGWVEFARVNSAQQLKALKAPLSKIEEALSDVSKADAESLNILVSRGLVSLAKEKKFKARVTPAGEQAAKETKAKATQLTAEDLKSGAWRSKDYAGYDLSTLSAPRAFGKKHSYKQFINGIKSKLVALGFREARGPLVELEFWNMDALFMAQDHPAREIHDVFQVDDPARGEILDAATLKLVKKAHETGLAGSKGWGYKWDPEVAARLVMRSQTTSVSARELAKGVKPPARTFCIGRVFRPDEIDWKHFIEFNQCEGIVAGEGMTFRELLGYLEDFAIEVFGAERVKFAPSYFPFTEPSVELYADIPGRGWAEVGGAGMFRPEMLEALGVRVPVIAWGLGIDRLAMIRLGAKDIRDLASGDIEYLRSH